MAYTAQQAIDLLRADPSAYASLDQLKGLVAQTDIFASGSVTVFYGRTISGVGVGDAIESLMGQRHDVRVLDKTEAFKFLNSDDFKAAVAKAYGIELAELKANLSDTAKSANDWLYEPKNGPWAES